MLLHFCRHEWDNPITINAIEALNEANKTDKIIFLFLAPWLRHIMPGLIGWYDQLKINTTLMEMSKEIINKTKERMDPKEDPLQEYDELPQDLVEAYLRKMYKVKCHCLCESVTTV